MRTASALLCLLLLTAGCSSGRDATPAASKADPGVPLGELPPQTLGQGQCALFLWSRSEPPRRVFMALNSPAVARVRIGGRTVDLPRTSFEGESAFGHYPEQRFAGEGVTLSMQVEIEARGALVGGAVAPSGTLTFADRSGESVVLPVAGLVACQS